MFHSSSRLSRGRAPLRSLSLCIAVGLAGACTAAGVSILVGGVLDFNPRMRADLGPLTPAQREDAQQTFSDAQGDSQLISPVFAPEMTSVELQRLRRADTFWTLGNRIDLSYELTIEDPRFGEESLSYSVAPRNTRDSGAYADLIGWAAGEGFTDPITRRLALFRGEPIVAPAPLDLTTHTVVLRTCSDGDVALDDNAPPGRLDQNCSDMEVSLETCLIDDLIVKSTTFPFTVMRCGVIFPRNASLSLEVIDRRSGQNIQTVQPILEHKARPLYPNLRELTTATNATRRLARPLASTGDECVVQSVSEPEGRDCTSLDEDPAEGSKVLLSSWSWQVGEDPSTGWWDENFSPRTMVTRVFLFVQDPKVAGAAGREYLLPDHIRALAIDKSYCPVTEEAETGRAVFDISECLQNIIVTPTYDHSDLIGPVTDRLSWRADFRVTAIGADFPDELPVKQGEELFIEFEITSVDTAQSRAGLRLEPAAYDFGDVEQGATDTRERAIRLSNVETLSQRVLELKLEGVHASDYFVSVTQGQRPPFTLAPGESVDLTLGIHKAQGSSAREADLRVTGEVAGASYDRWLAIRSYTVFADGRLLPESLGIAAPRGGGLQNPGQRTRRFLIESTGAMELEIFDVRVEGPDAGYFSLLESSTRSREWDIYELPYPLPSSIAPGDAHLLSVVYHPQSPTAVDFHRAEVVVEHSAGTQRIELWGDCPHDARGCNYDRPPAIAALAP